MTHLEKMHFLCLVHNNHLVVVDHHNLELPGRAYLLFWVDGVVVVLVFFEELTDVEGARGTVECSQVYQQDIVNYHIGYKHLDVILSDEEQYFLPKIIVENLSKVAGGRRGDRWAREPAH